MDKTKEEVLNENYLHTKESVEILFPFLIYHGTPVKIF